jgi:hypothetical protein
MRRQRGFYHEHQFKMRIYSIHENREGPRSKKKRNHVRDIEYPKGPIFMLTYTYILHILYVYYTHHKINNKLTFLKFQLL